MVEQQAPKKTIALISVLVALLLVVGAAWWFVFRSPVSGVDRQLLDAADAGNLQGVTNALNTGANPNAQLSSASYAKWTGDPDPHEGYSALHFACDRGNLEIAKVLISKGANVNLQTALGVTPLMLAASHMRTDYVQFLLSHGADRSVKNKWGSTASTMAQQRHETAESRALEAMLDPTGGRPSGIGRFTNEQHKTVE